MNHKNIHWSTTVSSGQLQIALKTCKTVKFMLIAMIRTRQNKKWYAWIKISNMFAKTKASFNWPPRLSSDENWLPPCEWAMCIQALITSFSERIYFGGKFNQNKWLLWIVNDDFQQAIIETRKQMDVVMSAAVMNQTNEDNIIELIGQFNVEFKRYTRWRDDRWLQINGFVMVNSAFLSGWTLWSPWHIESIKENWNGMEHNVHLMIQTTLMAVD